MAVVIIDPQGLPDLHRLLSAAKLQRPHYLDKDLTFLYPDPGNRVMLITLLSRNDRIVFTDGMCRQVFWWTRQTPPSAAELAGLEDFSGIFIPDRFSGSAVSQWQNVMAPQSQDLPALTFADAAMQKRWIRLTLSDDYWLDALPPYDAIN